ncbi:MAG TPA: MBOAT family O-acyltransferase, partial [Hyphomicrobiales bacterium]|nr:MBOAT family O-acyltransferase [Hyphomicrobiales bacterium]
SYILILACLILLDYWAGLLIERSAGARRKRFLLLSLAANILMLGVFKYCNFFLGSFGGLTRLIGPGWTAPVLHIVLPLGLSFHTFQSMSYTIEVYRGKQRAERHLGIYALYVMFYPQLVAGPIERPQHLLHQLRSEHHFVEDDFVAGLRLILLGFFKKVVVADRLALLVNAVYGDPRRFSGPVLLIATLFFSFQIYADFSGYSDIAIGAARVMGFRLMTNFRRPYFASSVAEFWQRWHISLSTWFRDYVYIPLGGSQTGWTAWQLNLLATFLISGLWHGANWTFVAWGAVNGLFLIGLNVLRSSLKLNSGGSSVALKALGTAATFGLISWSWVFFRASSLSEARFVFSRIFLDARLFLSPGEVWRQTASVAGSSHVLALAAAAIAGLMVVDGIIELQESGKLRRVGEYPVVLRWSVYYSGLAAILLMGSFNPQKFIYFQF